MAGDKFFEQCFLCKQLFRYGPLAYDGRPIREWGVMACDKCILPNRDGIVPNSDLMDFFSSHGIEIRLNGKGRIEWPR